MDRKLDELLFALMQNMTLAVSGEKLAKDLRVSHSTLLRWIEKLREAGIEIRGELFTGFRLVRLPDVLLPQIIRPRLRTRIIGRNLFHFYDVDSTNSFAGRLITHGRKIPEGTVVLAEAQTAGRGRLGRSWHSQREAGIYFSMVLFPKAPPSLAPLFTLATAVAMHNAVERYTGLDIDIKWPNDLLIGQRKFCGILSEIHAEVDLVKMMIIGVGLNANHESLPEDIAQRATSLRIASGHIQSRIEILLEFFEEFETIYMDFERKGPRSIIDQWTCSSSFANGRRIEIHDGVRKIAGVTRGLNPLGALRIEQKGGQIEEVYSGDVVEWE
ncbi:MAG TPA: biotin--[acetyl-CoA-carboxylase] ligase [Terriglobia bacterium]|jgi:BirA family biotin operon repressor/biotin-[acetyl-CoA-carboxylase] ligase